MKTLIKQLLFFYLITNAIHFSSQTNVTVENDYNNWGWNDVHVAKNKYISLAVVPAAAGRMLEFNLGDTPSLWINPKLFGQSFAPNEELNGTSDWRNFGGYRLVPIPTNNIAAANASGGKTSRWPPPAMIGDNPYTASITTDADNNKVINVISGIQQLPVPKFIGGSYVHPQTIDEELQYERNLFIEDEKSIININHTLYNVGTKTINRGLKITSQQTSRSAPNLEDGENFLAYIPFDKNNDIGNGTYYAIGTTPQNRWNFVNNNRMPISKSNPDHVDEFFNTGTNWIGEVSPGIYELHYDYNLMSGFKINSSKSWICFVDKLNLTAFAKMFEPFDNSKVYEFDINMEIYNSGLETGYLETEVKTPIYTLAPGESFDYKETQAAAKIANLPVLDVNGTGVITKKLNVNTTNLNGNYGVFIEGTAYVNILNSEKTINETIQIGDVNPLEAFVLDLLVPVPNPAELIYELYIIDSSNEKYILDELNLSAALNTGEHGIRNKIHIWPTPSNGEINIQAYENINGYEIFDLTGKTIYNYKKYSSEIIDLSALQAGVYLIVIDTNYGTYQEKIILK